MIRRGTLLAATLLEAAITLASGGRLEAAERVDQVAAVVEDRLITLYDVRQARRWMGEGGAPFSEVLDRLVTQTMIDREIEKLGIQVTEAEIDRAIREILANQGGDEKQLTQQLELAGTNMVEYRKSIADQLKQVKVVNQRVRANVSVTEVEILEEYQKLTSTQSEKKAADLQIIVLPGRTEPENATAEALAKRLHAQLREGADFGALARQYTQGPSPEDGGKMDGIEAGTLQPALDHAIFGLAEGRFSDPIQGQGAWFLVKLLKVHQRKNISLEEMKPKITDDLYRRKFDALFQAWVADLKNRTSIKILVTSDTAGSE